jgi:hypothetical protein
MKSPETTRGMYAWHAKRTPEQKEAFRQKARDAAVCQMWIPKGPRHGRKPGAKNKRKSVDPKTIFQGPGGTTTLAKIERASIKRIIKDLATTQPELFRDAIIAGLLAPAPRSYPYVFLAAQYLDGKPVDAEPVSQPIADLSELSKDDLIRRALNIAAKLQRDSQERDDLEREREARGTGLAIIDITPEPEPTLEELEAEVVRANEEVRLATEELERSNTVLRILRRDK